MSIETVAQLIEMLEEMPQDVKPYVELTPGEDVPIRDVMFSNETNEVIIQTE